MRTNQVNQVIRHPRTTFGAVIVNVNKLCGREGKIVDITLNTSIDVYGREGKIVDITLNTSIDVYGREGKIVDITLNTSIEYRSIW